MNSSKGIKRLATLGDLRVRMASAGLARLRTAEETAEAKLKEANEDEAKQRKALNTYTKERFRNRTKGLNNGAFMLSVVSGYESLGRDVAKASLHSQRLVRAKRDAEQATTQQAIVLKSLLQRQTALNHVIDTEGFRSGVVNELKSELEIEDILACGGQHGST